MSFDLAVFDPAAAPRNARAFTEWYDAQTTWSFEDDDVHKLATTAPALRAWFMDMIQEFPGMNGPFAPPGHPDETDEEMIRASDYSIAPSLIYVGFAGSKAQEAYEACTRLGAKHGVGFIDVSSDASDVLFPEERAEATHRRTPAPWPWRRLLRMRDRGGAVIDGRPPGGYVKAFSLVADD